MPTYEYECEVCGNRFEKVQKISDQTVPKCPECGAQARRLISGGAGLLFKGEGFYITDYRSESYKKAAKKETKDSGPEASTSSSTSTEKTGEKKKSEKKKSEKKKESGKDSS